MYNRTRRLVAFQQLPKLTVCIVKFFESLQLLPFRSVPVRCLLISLYKQYLLTSHSLDDGLLNQHSICMFFLGYSASTGHAFRLKLLRIRSSSILCDRGFNSSQIIGCCISLMCFYAKKLNYSSRHLINICVMIYVAHLLTFCTKYLSRIVL